MGLLTVLSGNIAGNMTKISQKSKMPQDLRGGGGMGGFGIDRYIKEQCQKQKHATNYKQLDQCMAQFNPVRQNKNKH